MRTCYLFYIAKSKLNQAPKISQSGWLGGTNMLITITEHNKFFKEVYITCRKGTINSICHRNKKIDYDRSEI